jgi:hypothetical protein
MSCIFSFGGILMGCISKRAQALPPNKPDKPQWASTTKPPTIDTAKLRKMRNPASQMEKRILYYIKKLSPEKKRHPSGSYSKLPEYIWRQACGVRVRT